MKRKEKTKTKPPLDMMKQNNYVQLNNFKEEEKSLNLV